MCDAGSVLEAEVASERKALRRNLGYLTPEASVVM